MRGRFFGVLILDETGEIVEGGEWVWALEWVWEVISFGYFVQ